MVTGACVGPAPRLDQVRLDLPLAWSAAPGLDADAPFHFLAQLQDPVLEALIGEALEQNHSLLAAAERVQAVVHARVLSSSQLFPTIQAGLEVQRSRRNYIGLPIPGLGDSVLTSTTTAWNGGLTAAWEVDLWGRVRASVRAGEADAWASRVELDGARLSLVGQVCRSWFALLEARQQVQLAMETCATWNASEEWMQKRHAAGVGPALDLRLTIANHARARDVLLQAQQGQDDAARAMRILLGRYPAGELEGGADFPSLPMSLPAGVPAALLARRPDLQAVHARATAAIARSQMARADLFPRISLTASAGRSSDDIADLNDSEFGVWSLATNLTRPLFDGGRLRAGVQIRDAEARAVLAEWSGLVLRACAEVESALIRCARVDQRLEVLGLAGQAFARAEGLAEEQYRSGLVGIAVVLDTRRGRLAAQAELLRLRRMALESRLDLWLALGGEAMKAVQ